MRSDSPGCVLGMQTDLQLRERRRGERVLIRIPIKVFGLARDNKHITEDAETVVVSRTGALLRCHSALKTGGFVEVTNGFTQKGEKFRVVWVSEQPKQGFFDVGIEFVTPHDEFWGIRFPSLPGRR
jgi:hypothetical protein